MAILAYVAWLYYDMVNGTHIELPLWHKVSTLSHSLKHRLELWIKHSIIYKIHCNTNQQFNDGHQPIYYKLLPSHSPGYCEMTHVYIWQVSIQTLGAAGKYSIEKVPFVSKLKKF